MKGKFELIVDYMGAAIDTIKVSIYLFFLYLSINPETIMILGYLMIAEGATNAVRHFRFKKEYNPNTFLWDIVVKIIIISIPAWGALGAKGIGIDLSQMVNLVIKILIASEVVSILTNSYCIITGKDVPKVDIISALLLTLMSVIRQFVMGTINKIGRAGKCDDSNETPLDK